MIWFFQKMIPADPSSWFLDFELDENPPVEQ
jgi:hypothetical protein